MAARSQLGEVEIKTEKGILLFKLGTNALCALEEKHNKTLQELLADLQSGKLSVRMLRSIVLSSIDSLENNDAAAGDLIDEIGIPGVTKAITESLTSLMAKNGAKAGKTNPRKAASAGAKE